MGKIKPAWSAQADPRFCNYPGIRDSGIKAVMIYRYPGWYGLCCICIRLVYCGAENQPSSHLYRNDVGIIGLPCATTGWIEGWSKASEAPSNTCTKFDQTTPGGTDFKILIWEHVFFSKQSLITRLSLEMAYVGRAELCMAHGNMYCFTDKPLSILSDAFRRIWPEAIRIMEFKNRYNSDREWKL